MREFLISLSKSEPNELPKSGFRHTKYGFHKEYFMPYLISGMVIGLAVCGIIVYLATN
jgi:hypothetical protein